MGGKGGGSRYVGEDHREHEGNVEHPDEGKYYNNNHQEDRERVVAAAIAAAVAAATCIRVSECVRERKSQRE